MLLKRAEKVLATVIVVKSNRITRKFPVLGIWICDIFLRSSKPVPRQMFREGMTTAKAPNPKRP